MQAREARLSMIKDAFSEPGMEISWRELDADPWFLNLRNCSLYLDRDPDDEKSRGGGEGRPGEPGHIETADQQCRDVDDQARDVGQDRGEHLDVVGQNREKSRRAQLLQTPQWGREKSGAELQAQIRHRLQREIQDHQLGAEIARDQDRQHTEKAEEPERRPEEFSFPDMVDEGDESGTRRFQLSDRVR